MSHETHDRNEFAPQHAESAEANGVIVDPPGRSPAEVDDSALRPQPDADADPDAEPTPSQGPAIPG